MATWCSLSGPCWHPSDSGHLPPLEKHFKSSSSAMSHALKIDHCHCTLAKHWVVTPLFLPTSSNYIASLENNADFTIHKFNWETRIRKKKKAQFFKSTWPLNLLTCAYCTCCDHMLVIDFYWWTRPLFPWVIALYYTNEEPLFKASQADVYYHVTFAITLGPYRICWRTARNSRTYPLHTVSPVL